MTWRGCPRGWATLASALAPGARVLAGWHVLAGSLALTAALAASALAQGITLPRVFSFEDPAYAARHAALAAGLEGRVEGGRLVVDSARRHGEADLYTYDLTGAGPHAVFADVTAAFPTGASGDLDGAGLVIRKGRGADGRASFYSILLTPGGFRCESWGTSGKSVSSGTLPDGIAPGSAVRLAAREVAGGRVEFFVAGQRVATLADGAITGTEVGLIVEGTGRYAFDEFGLNLAGDIADGTAAAPRPVPPTVAPAVPASAPAQAGSRPVGKGR